MPEFPQKIKLLVFLIIISLFINISASITSMAYSESKEVNIAYGYDTKEEKSKSPFSFLGLLFSVIGVFIPFADIIGLAFMELPMELFILIGFVMALIGILKAITILFIILSVVPFENA